VMQTLAFSTYWQMADIGKTSSNILEMATARLQP
jgi:hypothetical protein